VVSGWVLACALDELPEGKARRVELPGTAVCLVRMGSAVYAVEDRCPHRGARLSGGLVYDGCKLACPDHGWSIDLPTGQVEPPEQGRVGTCRVELRDGEVYLDPASLR
jgi:nitrite reductase (NADH) small subunit